MSGQEQTVKMRYATTAEVLPEYVPHYMDDGWTLATEHKPTAAERAMEQITALMDEHYAGNIFSPDVIAGVSRIVGRYDIERIGEQ